MIYQDTESEYIEFRHGKRVNMTDAGDVCILCGGHYDFPSEYAHGLRFQKTGDAATGNDTDDAVFLCWECAKYMHDRLSAQISSIAYGALFGKPDPIRPTRFLPWLEMSAENAPGDNSDK